MVWAVGIWLCVLCCSLSPFVLNGRFWSSRVYCWFVLIEGWFEAYMAGEDLQKLVWML